MNSFNEPENLDNNTNFTAAIIGNYKQFLLLSEIIDIHNDMFTQRFIPNYPASNGHFDFYIVNTQYDQRNIINKLASVHACIYVTDNQYTQMMVAPLLNEKCAEIYFNPEDKNANQASFVKSLDAVIEHHDSFDKIDLNFRLKILLLFQDKDKNSILLMLDKDILRHIAARYNLIARERNSLFLPARRLNMIQNKNIADDDPPDSQAKCGCNLF